MSLWYGHTRYFKWALIFCTSVFHSSEFSYHSYKVLRNLYRLGKITATQLILNAINKRGWKLVLNYHQTLRLKWTNILSNIAGGILWKPLFATDISLAVYRHVASACNWWMHKISAPNLKSQCLLLSLIVLIPPISIFLTWYV